ncbi:hypothetical protein FOHLNKBM_5055 [Methylobacterium longum]|nr:hypothetical protein FOHLNKBM_5055 [Methylobacterium longum]
MSARTMAVWFASSSMLLVTAQPGLAAETTSHFALQPQAKYPDPERTASVTLGTLSVRRNPMDQPWDPRVCIGCDRNNGPSPGQNRAHRFR